MQDVFLAIWQKRASFDPTRGTFKAWTLQIARNRVLNELRRRRGGEDGASADVETIADDVATDELHWLAYRRSKIRSAIEALPPAERQALSLAFLDDLTNAQVAAFLEVPLGTTKSRIRAALRRLAPILAVLVAALLFFWLRRREHDSDVTRRALRMTTASDVVPLRLTPAPEYPTEAHGTYRARARANAGSDVVVLTVSKLPPAPDGQEYDAWVRYGGYWSWLGTVSSDADGRALMVAEIAVHGEPELLRVTREPSSSDHREPRGPAVLTWTRP